MLYVPPESFESHVEGLRSSLVIEVPARDISFESEGIYNLVIPEI